MRRLVLASTAAIALALPSTATADDSIPAEWQTLSAVTPLLLAPEPPEPVAVCVVDSGVNLTPDLAPVVTTRLAYDGGDPGDSYPLPDGRTGHGTYVATFIAGQVNGWGSSGVWPRARIVSVRVFPPGKDRADAFDVLEGLRFCSQQSAVRVINLSLGSVRATAAEWLELEDRIVYYRAKRDINVVAAAGNGGGEVEKPARFHSAFAVGSANTSGAACAYSARGEELDLLVSGCTFAMGGQDGRVTTVAGTSYAAPVAAATIAAIRAYAGASADEAERALVSTGRGGPNGPVLDATAALRATGLDSLVPSAVAQAPAGALHLPLPRFRARCIAKERRLVVRALNRPAHVTLEVRVRRSLRLRRTDLQRLDVRRCPHEVRVRFRFDGTKSPLVTGRVR